MSKRTNEESNDLDKRVKYETNSLNVFSQDKSNPQDLQQSPPQTQNLLSQHQQSKQENAATDSASSAVAAAQHQLSSVNSMSTSLPSMNGPSMPLPFQPTTLPPGKPGQGTEEWHKLRKENHREVERRRRENINAGIRELASLIPTSDTNKSQILQRAVEYIKRLKENETNNIEKWTLEKLLTEQAVSELDASNTKLKQELERAYREIESLKRLLKEKE